MKMTAITPGMVIWPFITRRLASTAITAKPRFITKDCTILSTDSDVVAFTDARA